MSKTNSILWAGIHACSSLATISIENIMHDRSSIYEKIGLEKLNSKVEIVIGSNNRPVDILRFEFGLYRYFLNP